ncbi:MAG: hypothetical protein JSV96_04220 [Candidatus Aminicenantes bacterium]|nr:MAG: hypothetical protein JSV96_04220 [Candidatus Aminicenantes bacterium]
MIRILLKEAAPAKSSAAKESFSYEKELAANDLSDLGVAYHLYKHGFRGQDLIEGVHIVLGESEGKTKITNKNTNGSTDYGMWQFNNFAHFKDSAGYNRRIDDIKKRFAETIKVYMQNKRMTPQQKTERINKIKENEKKAIESLKVSGAIPFISSTIALDPSSATKHALAVLTNNIQRRGNDGKWKGWVDNVSQLVGKYGAAKLERAKAAVAQLNQLLQQQK